MARRRAFNKESFTKRIRLMLAFLFSVLAVSAYSAELMTCAVPGVRVFSDQAKDGDLACQAVGSTLAFMKSMGFHADTRFTIELVDHPLSLHGSEVTGTYDSRHLYIEVPNFSQAQRVAGRHAPFGMFMSHEIWQSFIAHEVAHAVAQANFRLEKPGITAHEYIAYVVQLATLPKETREELLKRFDNSPFRHERQINRVFLELDPEVFAVKAYRHYLAQPDPSVFFQRLLTRRLISPR
ncbi:hypothetical protein SAMN04487881_2482 [Marinobacter sp. es.048]|uniref:DUF6639 family protein n=1 Tax=Marinobacter sp. es.048 TaxID=1761795 RepID=UPI000B6DA29F|nr:DUF6639 family protein [Marinobacter sp. es.048]SNC74641.1 hypothetical protein SAMN04487881_2482 [Marinobacter sp. es.048]